MTENKRKIDFKVKDYDIVELDLDDFIWLITQLYYSCNAVGCVPSMHSCEKAQEIIDILFENNLNLYID